MFTFFFLDYNMGVGRIAPLWEYVYFNSVADMSSANLKLFT